MAGVQPENRINTDILFDLDSEDTKTLKESELLQLVNFGQLSKSYDFPGTDGKVYTVYFSVLWEDDYLDVLQKTTKYAADPILRSRVMRRLIVFKAIQRINTMDFSNPDDIAAKRLLWTALCRMSDIMVQSLEAQYKEMEAENQITVMEAIRVLSDKLEETKPSSLKKEVKDKDVVPKPVPEEKSAITSESDAHFAPFSAGQEHAELVAQLSARQTSVVKEAVKAVETQVILDDTVPKVTSPKK